MVNEVIRDDFEHRQHFYLMGTLAKPYWIEISLVQYTIHWKSANMIEKKMCSVC